MELLRARVLKHLKARFPAYERSILPLDELLDQQTDGRIVFPAPGIVVSILNAVEPPAGGPFGVYDLQCNMGVVVTVKEARASDADIAGWKLTTEVAKFIRNNCWGFDTISDIAPAVITQIAKQQQRDKSGTRTGSPYWTITFFNSTYFDTLLTRA